MQFPYFTVLFFLTGITLHFVLPPTVERVSASEDPSEIMRAAFYTTHGPPSVLQVGSVARPLPKYDQLLVKVEASALNPCDFKFRRAVMPSLLANFIWPKPKVHACDSLVLQPLQPLLLPPRHSNAALTLHDRSQAPTSVA